MASNPSTTTAQSQRPPIVAVMGHVDHGKTTLLDYIRKSNVAGREAGGITQSIGAYEILHNGRKVTFIDTPGHEAFSKMRSRGAHIADLAILVVAADEGVKPQTQESIKTILESKTPFVVAITKIDKEGADIEKVKNELLANEVYLEGFGGSTSYQPVSAKSGDHVDELLDLILLAADLEDLAYDPSLPASGFVLEAKVDHRRGLEATVIVTNGTLRQGKPIATKSASGKIKILENFLNKPVKELTASAPALVIGFENLPHIGEEFSSGDMGDLLQEVIASHTKRAAPIDPKEKHLLRLVLKASDSGSLEALYEILKGMALTKPMKIVGDAVGDVNDNDVKFAISSEAMIVAFKSRIDKAAKLLAETNKIPVVSSDIIYDLVKEIEATLVNLAKPTSAGELEVLAVFNAARVDKQVIGGRVTHGTIRVRSPIAVRREGVVIGQGRLTNLQQEKKDVNQTSAGEAGLKVSATVPILVGDTLVMIEEQ